jgi:DNA-binding winged helix-turn-helix (wHTH) protein
MGMVHNNFVEQFPHLVQMCQSKYTSECNIYALAFRGYRVYPTARKLTHNETVVEIGSRAFDLLVTLLHARGRLMSKEEIVRHVWPSTTVDECNLRFQMAVLRKALGQDRDVIKTVPGRGYLFAEEISKYADEEVWPATPEASSGLVVEDADEIPSGSKFALAHEQRTIDQLQAELLEIVTEIIRLRGATPGHALGGLILVVPEGRTIGRYAEA